MKKSLLLAAALFAVAVMRAASPPFGRPEATPAPKAYIITDYGAVGDGQTVNTKALQAVIDQCAANGGGVVVVPPGTFLSGALYFKQGVNLRVDKDGVLKSTTVRADFPPIYTSWEGIERYWTSAFLNFVGMKNVDVSGDGLIDGSGLDWSSGFGRGGGGGRGRGGPGGANAAGPGARGGFGGFAGGGFGGRGNGQPAGPLPKPEDVYPSPLPTTATINIAPDPAKLPIINAAGIPLPGGGLAPPRSLVFQNCENVSVSGLHLKNEARWGFVFIYCDNVVASNLTAKCDSYIPSSDGMDICSCRHVLVTGCSFDCFDDDISIKSGKDADGLRVNRPTEDVIIEKTHFGSGDGGAAMGSETSGGIRNVIVRDCTADSRNGAPIRFKSQPSRGGVVENITYENITINDARVAFVFDLQWNMRISNGALPSKTPPLVRNIKIINVNGLVDQAGSIAGLADSPITNVTFQNCHITSYTGLRIQHAKNLDLSGLKVDSEDGQPIVRLDADNSAPTPPATAPPSAPGA